MTQQDLVEPRSLCDSPDAHGSQGALRHSGALSEAKTPLQKAGELLEARSPLLQDKTYGSKGPL